MCKKCFLKSCCQRQVLSVIRLLCFGIKHFSEIFWTFSLSQRTREWRRRRRGWKKRVKVLAQIKFISAHDRLFSCTSFSIEEIKVFNVTIYRNLAAEITTNYDTLALNGRIRTLFLRKAGQLIKACCWFSKMCKHTDRASVWEGTCDLRPGCCGIKSPEERMEAGGHCWRAPTHVEHWLLMLTQNVWITRFKNCPVGRHGERCEQTVLVPVYL